MNYNTILHKCLVKKLNINSCLFLFYSSSKIIKHFHTALSFISVKDFVFITLYNTFAELLIIKNSKLL